MGACCTCSPQALHRFGVGLALECFIKAAKQLEPKGLRQSLANCKLVNHKHDLHGRAAAGVPCLRNKTCFAQHQPAPAASCLHGGIYPSQASANVPASTSQPRLGIRLPRPQDVRINTGPGRVRLWGSRPPDTMRRGCCRSFWVKPTNADD